MFSLSKTRTGAARLENQIGESEAGSQRISLGMLGLRSEIAYLGRYMSLKFRTEV